MANEPIPPSTIEVTPGEAKNTLAWNYFPNEYFNDFDNWTIAKVDNAEI